MIEIDVVELEKLISGLENEISDYEKNVNQINLNNITFFMKFFSNI